jgi:hypothetical protein
MTARGVLSACAALALAGAAAARESTASWSFEVAALEELGPEEQVLRLVPVPGGPRFPRSCAALVVRVKRDAESLPPERRGLARPEAHALALRVLRVALESKQLLRFGRVEDGFGPRQGSDACEVASRALTVFREGDGAYAVYSLFQ